MHSTSVCRAFAAVLLATATSSGLAAANEQIVVRSGQVSGAPGSPGQLDDTIRSISLVACNQPLVTHAFTAADFAAAGSGPLAMLCQPLPTWAWDPSLPEDPLARWINYGSGPGGGYGPTTTPASVLYAVPFTVTTAVVDTATVTLAWRVDDHLGDIPGSNPVGLYVNGVPLDMGFSNGPSPHSQTCVPIHTGANLLYVYQRDTGCSDAGVMFSCTIDVDTPLTCPDTVFCAGDGLTAPCPCGNDGLHGRGCENALTTGGGWLTRTGAASINLDTIQFTCSGERPTSLSIVLQGTSAIAPTNYADGLRCVGGALKRLYSKNAVGGTIVAPATGEPSVSAQSAAKGDPLSPGMTRYYQVYYRDPEPTFCAAPLGGTFNVSNGIVLNWEN